MGTVLGMSVGSVAGTLGFLVMRNPLRLAFFASGAEGYYQRLVLDRWQRIGMRVLGVLICLFGLVILTATSAGLLKQPALHAVSDALLVLLWVVFCAAWILGAILFVVQLIQGRALDALLLWRRGLELGPIDVYPAITPAMQKEANIFTLTFCVLVGIAVCVGLYGGS